MNGVLVIDKPEGMTSHDVVQYVRRLFGTSRVGHLGTLDPMATGILPLCIGKATRIGQFFPTSPKEYIGEIRLGLATTTYDRQGEPTGPEQYFGGTAEDVERSMRSLTGLLDQIPPAYSAKRIAGVRSHRAARRGEVVEHAAVKVKVDAFELQNFSHPFLQFRVVCGGGTYVRSLAHDLGRQLGCGAHLTSLRRLRSGDFSMEQAIVLDKASISDLRPMETFFAHWPIVAVSGVEERRARQGNPIPAETDPGYVRILNKQGEFLAVAVAESGWAHPRVVLTSTTSDDAGISSTLLS
jgi:tRNA pseudouridine55 synthase